MSVLLIGLLAAGVASASLSGRDESGGPIDAGTLLGDSPQRSTRPSEPARMKEKRSNRARRENQAPQRKAEAKRKRQAHVTIAAVGDIGLGTSSGSPPGGARSMFRSVRAHLAGDVVIGNLETTLATGGSPRCDIANADCYLFRAPPAFAEGLAGAGFTTLNLANNHAFDYGAEGARETRDALRRAGLQHTGLSGRIAYQRAGPVRVAVLGFAPYGWAENLLDLDGARRLVRKADRKADVVVVTMHAGGEGTDRAHLRTGREIYLGEPRGDPIAFAHAVVDAGADLVLGHGPHVLRAMEWYKDRLIAYSLGNFASYRNFDVTGALGISAILRVTLRGDGSWVDGKLVPVTLEPPGIPRPDSKKRAVRVIRQLSREDIRRNAIRITEDGTVARPQS